MKKRLEKQIFKNTLFFSIYIFILEIIVKINTNNSIIDWSIIRIIISSLILGLILGLLLSLLKGKALKIISSIVAFLLMFYTWVEINLYNYIGFFMGIGNVEQGTKIVDYIKDFIAASKFQSYLVIIPFIIFIVYVWVLDRLINKKILEKTSVFVYKRETIKRKGLVIIGALVLLLILSSFYYYTIKTKFMQNKLQSVSNTELLLSSDNSNLSVSQFGIFAYGLSDLTINIFNIEVTSEYNYQNNEEYNKETTDYTRHIDDTAWNYIIENEKNISYNMINKYLISRDITDKNEYTGIFEGKNLIIILMESVNMISINEKEFPTIYKIYNEGISFRNNYSPRNNCSTGNNEMTVMTSLFTINNTCTANRYKNNKYPEAIFNMFNNAGYVTSSYHDYAEHYYYRRTIHPNMGSMAYYNVQDLKIKWTSTYEEWPSDVDLVEKATPKFINEDKFMVFLTSVTTHQPYVVSSEYGDKHLSEFKDYSYSKAVKRYMSKMKELDMALELLLQKLEEAGKLEDTVIALFADHYPYGLTNTQINEVLDYNVKIDNEVDRTPMVIYNSEINPLKVEKYTSIIDLLPTLLNMFNLEYDPRLYLGTDILSDSHGRTVFADGSWQDEVGYYNATSGKFKPKDESITYTSEELIEINKEINTRQKMSANAIKIDYFNYLQKQFNKYNELFKEAEEEVTDTESEAN